MFLGRIIGIMTLLLLAIVSSAQDESCPALVEEALATVGDNCSELGRNQVCYGNNEILAYGFDEATLADFEQAGDLADVPNVRSLVTAPLDEADNVWGIAVLAVQANLPDTTPGQGVTFVLYGDTELVNEVEPPSDTEPEPVTLNATANSGMNVRRGTSTNFGIVGSLPAGENATLLGRNDAGDWAQIIINGTPGWVYVPLLTVDGDISDLDVLESDSSVDIYTMPMQAFRFRMGVGTPQCDEAPRDGLLIQAPQETTVNFRINGIDVSIGSTALVRAEDENTVVFYNLQGNVEVTSIGVTQPLQEGQFTQATSNTAPTAPQAYDLTEVRNVPTPLLPDSFQTGFDGVWTNTDLDGSSQTITINYIADNTYELEFFDEGASACDPEGSTQYSISANATATLNGSTLTASADFVCADPDNTTFTGVPLSFRYNFETNNELIGITGELWFRSN